MNDDKRGGIVGRDLAADAEGVNTDHAGKDGCAVGRSRGRGDDHIVLWSKCEDLSHDGARDLAAAGYVCRFLHPHVHSFYLHMTLQRVNRCVQTTLAIYADNTMSQHMYTHYNHHRLNVCCWVFLFQQTFFFFFFFFFFNLMPNDRRNNGIK